MKLKLKNVLYLAAGVGVAWLIVKQLPKIKATLAGLGESNPLVGQIPAYDFRNRKIKAFGNRADANANTSVAPLVALDDIRSAPIARYSFGDNGFGRY